MALVAESLLMAHVTCLLILVGKLAVVIGKGSCMIETRENEPVGVVFMAISTDWPPEFECFRVEFWKHVGKFLFGGTGIEEKRY